MTTETQNKLDEFRAIEPEYFENGKAFFNIASHVEILEKMLSLINSLETELNQK